MRKLKLLLSGIALLVAGQTWATDYLTDFSQYTVNKTAVSNDNTSGTAREFWRNGVLGFDVFGTSTEVPNGVYTYSVQAMYRGHKTKDIPTGIIAYAESDGAQYMTPICNYTDGTTGGESLGAFATAFGTADNYLNTIPYVIVVDGKIKVGVKSMSTQPYCNNGMWFIFNTASFKVTEVSDDDVLATALADIKAQAAGLLASNSDESTERSNLQTAYNDATATAADIVNVKQKIDAYLARLVELAELANPLDVSYYFTNPKYSIRNLDLVGGLVTSGNAGSVGQPFGWTCFDAGGAVDDGSGNKFQENQGYNWFTTVGNTTTLDGQAANYDAEKTGGYSIYNRISWNQWAEQTHSAKQTVTLPAGKYKVSVPAYASAKNDDYKGYVIFNIGGTEYNNQVTAGSWNVYEKEFTITETTEVSVDLQFKKLRRAQNVGKQYSYFDGVTLLAYGDPLKALKAELTTLEGTLSGILADDEYENVVGTERTALSGYSRPDLEETNEAYQGAIDDLQDAIDAFTAAKTNYDALVREIAKAKALGIVTATADSYAATSSSTAATALTNTRNLKVAEYNYVNTNYAYGVTLGTWTTTGPTGSLSEQHYKGSGNPYLEQSSAAWASDGWTIKYAQDLTLPAGDYVFKVAGRQANSDGVTLSLTVKNGATTIGTVSDFPKGDTGLGINTSGATDFTTGEGHEYVNGGAGRGWEWRYVQFTLDEDATVNIAVDAVATLEHMWVSFCDATVQTNNAANISLIAYNIALNDANLAIDNSNYDNVTGEERDDLQDAIDADGSLDKADKDAIDAAKDALVAATTAFTDAKASYDAFVAAKAVEYEDNLPYASSTKFAAIGTAQAATATSASDAEAKTTAIISAYRKYVESNALAEGVDGAESIVIDDPNMDVTYDSENHTFGAWEVIGQTNGTIQLLSSQSFTDGDGNSNYKYADIYKNDNNAGIQQTVNLEPGRYILTVTARAQATAGATFRVFAGDATADIERIGNSGGIFDRGWNDAAVEFNVLKTSDVNIGVQSGNGKDLWWSATRFRLVRLGNAQVTIDEGVNYTVAAGTADVTLKRTLKADTWNTFVVPFDITNSELTAMFDDVEVAEYSEVAVGENSTVSFTKMATPSITANTPVLLKTSTDETSFEFTNKEIKTGDAKVAGTNFDFVGTYAASSTIDADDYFISSNKLYKSAGSTTIAGTRAYIKANSAEARIAGFSIGEDEPTGISTIATQKVDNAAYDMQGRRVETMKKGVYVVNGKKVVIK